MTPARGLVMAVALVAAPIVATEQALARGQLPLISHLWWPAVEDARMRPVAAAVWATLTYHLWRPRRSWGRALAAGAVSGATLAAVAAALEAAAARVQAGGHVP